MCKHIFFVLLFIPSVLGYFRNGVEYDSPEQADIYPYLMRLKEQLPDILDMLLEDDVGLPHWTEDDRENLLRGREAAAEEEEDDCGSCRAALLALMTMVNAANDYEDLKNLTMDVCYELVPPSDPELLCEGALDTYGPHVVFVLNETDKSPLQICTQYNNCFRNKKETPKAKSTDQGPFPAKIQKAPSVRRHGRTNKELEGTIKVLHISDIHVDEFYTRGAATECAMPLCCRANYEGEGAADRWGHYPCNIPYETMDQYFSHLSTLEPDMIIYTGMPVKRETSVEYSRSVRRSFPDIMNNAKKPAIRVSDWLNSICNSPPNTVWAETQAGQLNVSEQVALYIHQHFPGVPAFTTIGNHEIYPSNLYYLPRSEIKELNVELAKYWKDLSGFGDEQIRTFEEAGYFSILVRPGLRVMGYNIKIMATDNFYNILNDDTAEEYLAMREYMRSELESARAIDEKVIFIGHHPTGSGGSINYEGYFLTGLLAEFGDVVVFYLLGHNHGDDFRIIRDLDTFEPRVPTFSGAAMTTYDHINPSAKMFFLDPDTFTPLDAQAYAVDMALHGNADELVVEPVYTYSEEYSLPDLTAQSLYDLTERFQTDPDLLWRYRYNARTRQSDPGPCDEDCLKNETCDILNNVYELTRACKNAV